jgi:hypothetical protein
MPESVRWKSLVGLGLVAAAVAIMATPALADSTAVLPPPTAAVGVRVLYDSAGCPATIELLLEATADTIRGLEVLLQWDRPDAIQFVRRTKPSDSARAVDTLAGLLAPKDRSTLLPLETAGLLLDRWEFVQARSFGGSGAKIIGVAQVLSDSGHVAILPGQSGVLCRLPIHVIPSQSKDSTAESVALSVDRMGTHLATSHGDLARLAPSQPAIIRLEHCNGRRPQRE